MVKGEDGTGTKGVNRLVIVSTGTGKSFDVNGRNELENASIIH